MQLRYNLVTYGFGVRQCLGKYLADHTIKTLIIALVQRFHWTLFDEEDTQLGSSGAWAAKTDTEIEMFPRIVS